MRWTNPRRPTTARTSPAGLNAHVLIAAGVVVVVVVVVQWWCARVHVRIFGFDRIGGPGYRRDGTGEEDA
jgi:hypothetical protein